MGVYIALGYFAVVALLVAYGVGRDAEKREHREPWELSEREWERRQKRIRRFNERFDREHGDD